MDAIDPAIDCVAALRLEVYSPVVVFVGGGGEAPEPFRGVRQELVAASGAADRAAVLEGGLRLRLRRDAALPAQEAEHGVAIVERHPGTRVHVTRELASGHLAPERKQEVGEAPVGAVASGGTVG